MKKRQRCKGKQQLDLQSDGYRETTNCYREAMNNSQIVNLYRK